MKLACLQTAGLGWYAFVAMETSSSWQQADYKLLSVTGTYVPNMKLEQSLKCMPLFPGLQHFHANKLYNLLSLPEGTCLPNMKLYPFKCQSYKGKLLKQAG